MTETPSAPSLQPRRPWRWVFALLRVVFLIVAAWLVWYVAGNYNRWTGAAWFETTDDAYVAGDVTPLSARVSGYIENVAVDDCQTVHKGDLLATIDPSDYQAQLALAQANLAAAQASLAQLANQRDVHTGDKVVGAEIVRTRGGRVIPSQLTQRQSTTALIGKANSVRAEA